MVFECLSERASSRRGGLAQYARAHACRRLRRHLCRDTRRRFGGDATKIKAPSLFVAGSEDGATPPDLVRGSARLVPGARFEEIAGSGHLPCIDQPLKIVSLIAQHLLEAGYV